MADDAVLITSVQNETRIEFPENRLLAGLCGEFDRNLTTIEADLSLQIVRRGNQLLLIGDEDSRARAGSILPALYNRLEQGRSVQTADILAELRMHVTKNTTAEPGGGTQMEMFRGGKIEIKTRKKLIEPRTDAQHAYVQALFKNQMAFGIGPAGTGKTYLAVAVGVSMFITGQVDKIIHILLYNLFLFIFRISVDFPLHLTADSDYTRPTVSDPPPEPSAMVQMSLQLADDKN